MSGNLQPPADLVERFGEALTTASDGAWELQVPSEAVHQALAYLGAERVPPFDLFVDMFGVDYGDEFEVVYHLSRVMTPELVRIRTRVPRRGGKVTTATDIWAGASWPERELIEMYGVMVEGHPDPRNLLLPTGWKGFPLRKDYEYPQDHPYLARDPLHEDPAAYLGDSPQGEA